MLIQDRIWYVPDHYEHYDLHSFPGWDHKELFGNDKPVKIEYCSGNGTWIIDKAINHPEYNWVAVEKMFERVRKLWAKMKNRRVPNLVILAGEGYTATKHYIPSNSVDEIFVNFPDPWPKDRHAKHRIIQPKFVQEMQRILAPEKTAMLVTDDVDYSGIMVEEMLSAKGFSPCYEAPYFRHEHEGYGTSFFEELWRSKGKKIHYHQFKKVPCE